MMNPKERVLASVKHQYPDRLPTFLMGFEDTRPFSEYFQTKDEWDICKKLGVDIKIKGPKYIGKNIQIAKERSPISYQEQNIGDDVFSFSPQTFGIPNTKSFSHQVCTRPLSTAESVKEIEEYTWPDPKDFDYKKYTLDIKHTDREYATICKGWMPVFSRYLELVGMEEGLIKLHTHPNVVESILEKIGDFYLGFINRIIQECGEYLDFMGMGDDFAGQRGLLLSPAHWRKYLRPIYKKLFQRVKESHLYIWFHACGSFPEVLPDLIDLGLDTWESVQVHLPGNEPRKIKKEYGNHITFAGGINSQKVLPFGDYQMIKKELEDISTILGENGGYICGPDHTIMADVPIENVITLYKLATTINYTP